MVLGKGGGRLSDRRLCAEVGADSPGRACKLPKEESDTLLAEGKENALLLETKTLLYYKERENVFHIHSRKEEERLPA